MTSFGASRLRAAARQPWVPPALVAVLLGVLLATAFPVSQVFLRQPLYTGNVGELKGALEVGQGFVSARKGLSGVAFQSATYGGRKNTAEIVFELRSRLADPTPLRTVRAKASAFGDHRLHFFRFPAIADAAGKSYYASLRSPDSTAGNAITVDFSSENPYAAGDGSSMVLLRRGREGSLDLRNGIKPRSDLAFAVAHQIPLGERLVIAAGSVLGAIRRDPARSWLEIRLLAFALLFAAAAVGLSSRDGGRSPWQRASFLAVLLLAGFTFRTLYVGRLPYTNDEGFSLYDARTLLEGRFPGGDGILKTPSYLGMLALGLGAFGISMTTARLLSVAAGLMTVFPLLSLLRDFAARERTSLSLGALWLLAAAPVAFSVYAHAQPFQVLLGVSALACFGIALRSSAATRLSVVAAVLAGVAFALALAARKTSLAYLVPALLLFFGSSLSWWRRVSLLLATLVPVFLTLLAFVGIEYALYGPVGVRYFSGIEIAKIDPETTASAEERRSALVKGVLPIFREGLPLLALALVGLGGTLERGLSFLRGAGKRVHLPVWARSALPRLGWLLPLGLFWYGTSFLRRHESSAHFAFGVWPFWLTLGMVIALLALLPRRETALVPERSAFRALSFPLLWLAATTLLYASWIKFTASYLAEFLPPLVFLAAVGAEWVASAFSRPLLLRVLLAVFLATGAYASSRSAYTFPHTGTFDPSSFREAARVLKSETPETDLVLTGAVGIPAVSGHRVPFDIAHPTHYGYGYIEPKVRNVYLAPAEDMIATVRQRVRWVVLEKVTAFSYFREYPEIERLVREQFVPVREIENLSNPITILKLKETHE